MHMIKSILGAMIVCCPVSGYIGVYMYQLVSVMLQGQWVCIDLQPVFLNTSLSARKFIFFFFVVQY